MIFWSLFLCAHLYIMLFIWKSAAWTLCTISQLTKGRHTGTTWRRIHVDRILAELSGLQKFAPNLYFIFRKRLSIQIILVKLSRTYLHISSEISDKLQTSLSLRKFFFVFFLILFRIYWDLQNLFADLNSWHLGTDVFGEGWGCFLFGIH